MTVRELMERMENLPSDATVNVSQDNGTWHTANQLHVLYDDMDGRVDVLIDYLE